MYVMDATSLDFGMVTGLAIYKAYIFGDDDLVITSSTLIPFGLLKTFILSSSMIAKKFFGFCHMMDHRQSGKYSTFHVAYPLVQTSYEFLRTNPSFFPNNHGGLGGER